MGRATHNEATVLPIGHAVGKEFNVVAVSETPPLDLWR